MEGLWVMTLTLLCLTVRFTQGKEDLSHNITIRCPETADDEHCDRIKHPTEYELQLQCHITDTHRVTFIRWINHNGTDINTLNDTRMHYDISNTTSTLTIASMLLEDSGNYTCTTSQSGLIAIVILEAYIMPDYFVAGMVLLGVNMGLCVFFIFCMSWSIYRQYQIVKRGENRKFRPIPELDQEVISGRDINKC